MNRLIKRLNAIEFVLKLANPSRTPWALSCHKFSKSSSFISCSPMQRQLDAVKYILKQAIALVTFRSSYLFRHQLLINTSLGHLRIFPKESCPSDDGVRPFEMCLDSSLFVAGSCEHQFISMTAISFQAPNFHCINLFLASGFVTDSISTCVSRS